jgi:DNA-binding response OmpR family regulator
MPSVTASQRILLVEDQREAAEVLRAGLESLDAGFTVVDVKSAEDALKALDKGAFDLLIADVMLPGISGLELMARFRRRNPETKVILVSGVHDPEIRKQVARSGAEAFFFKPMEMSDLLDAVERLFDIAKSFLPSEMKMVKAQLADSDIQSGKVADQLSELRFNLQAQAAALINDRGQIFARAGALPDPQIETSLMPHLMSVFFAASRIATFTNAPKPDDLIVVRGKDYHLHLSSISTGYALLLVTKPLKAARTAAVAEALQKSVERLAPMLSNLEESAQSKAEKTKPRKKRDLSDTDPHLEKLLDQADTKPTNPQKIAKYWKTTELPSLPQPGALTYEQAVQLGLAPED